MLDEFFCNSIDPFTKYFKDPLRIAEFCPFATVDIPETNFIFLPFANIVEFVFNKEGSAPDQGI